MITLNLCMYCTEGKFGDGKLSKFSKSSMICQTKTIQISNYYYFNLLADIFIWQTFFPQNFLHPICPVSSINITTYYSCYMLLWSTYLCLWLDHHETGSTHKQICSHVKRHTRIAAEKMKTKYNKCKRTKIVEFSIGDSVTVKVPKLDRGHCGLCTLPGVVVKRVRGCYKIITKYGILK